MRRVAQALWRWSNATLRYSMRIALHEPANDTVGLLVPHGQPAHHGYSYISLVAGRKWFTRSLLLLLGIVVFWVPAAVLGFLAVVAFGLAFLVDLPASLLRSWSSRSDSIVPR